MPFDFPAAFQASPFEIIFLSVFAAAVIIAVIVSVTRYSSRRRAMSDRARADHRRHVDEEVELLDAESRAVLERISWLARNDEERRILKEDPFNSGRKISRLARRALEEGMVELREAARLLHTLGIDARSLRRQPTAAQALSPGTQVSLSDGAGTVVRGEVRESTDAEIAITVHQATGELASEAPVEVVGFKSAYLTTFESRTMAASRETVTIEASERVRVAQRRQYNRVPVRLKVDILPKDPGKPEFRARTYEMSAGGASIRNSHRVLETGEHVDCIIRPDDRPVRVRARVSATSHRDRIAHLTFESLDATLKHRILRLLFSRRRG